MPEYIMSYNLDENGKLIKARRKEELTRCKDCGFRIKSECNRVGQTVKPDDFCSEGRR